MHQSLDHVDNSHDAETATLQQRIRRALARDLQLPEQHPAVDATLNILAEVAHHHSSADTRVPISTGTTLDTWWCIVAHAHALAGR